MAIIALKRKQTLTFFSTFYPTPLSLLPTFPQFASTANTICVTSSIIPNDLKYFLGIISAASYKCFPLVYILEVQFLLSGGDPSWLSGELSAKLVLLVNFNKKLAKQPWKITQNELKELLVFCSSSELVTVVFTLVFFRREAALLLLSQSKQAVRVFFSKVDDDYLNFCNFNEKEGDFLDCVNFNWADHAKEVLSIFDEENASCFNEDFNECFKDNLSRDEQLLIGHCEFVMGYLSLDFDAASLNQNNMYIKQFCKEVATEPEKIGDTLRNFAYETFGSDYERVIRLMVNVKARLELVYFANIVRSINL